jgi:hypothetical protein
MIKAWMLPLTLIVWIRPNERSSAQNHDDRDEDYPNTQGKEAATGLTVIGSHVVRDITKVRRVERSGEEGADRLLLAVVRVSRVCVGGAGRGAGRGWGREKEKQKGVATVATIHILTNVCHHNIGLSSGDVSGFPK